MTRRDTFDRIKYRAVLVAAAAAWLVGIVWYEVLWESQADPRSRGDRGSRSRGGNQWAQQFSDHAGGRRLRRKCVLVLDAAFPAPGAGASELTLREPAEFELIGDLSVPARGPIPA